MINPRTGRILLCAILCVSSLILGWKEALDALQEQPNKRIVVQTQQLTMQSKQRQRQILVQLWILLGAILAVGVMIPYIELTIRSAFPVLGGAALETVNPINYTVDKLFFWMNVLQHPLFFAPSNLAQIVAYWQAVLYGYSYVLVLGSATAGVSLNTFVYLLYKMIDYLKSAQEGEMSL
jgi:hypothetical protein